MQKNPTLLRFFLVTDNFSSYWSHFCWTAQQSQPLDRSSEIPVLNGFVNTIDWDQNQSDLSDLILSMRRITGSPWIADFRYWTWPEVAILDADQKERNLWGRECSETNPEGRRERRRVFSSVDCRLQWIWVSLRWHKLGDLELKGEQKAALLQKRWQARQIFYQ